MTVFSSSGTLKKFRRIPWRFQQTIERPPAADLEKFVSTLFSAHHKITTAIVTIDEIVFNSDRLAALCPAGSTLSHDTSISADSFEEVQDLLVAAFMDGP